MTIFPPLDLEAVAVGRLGRSKHWELKVAESCEDLAIPSVVWGGKGCVQINPSVLSYEVGEFFSV